MKKIYYITDLEELKALSDPLRVNILMELGTTPKNSNELSSALEIPRTRIHYHLKIMEDMGFIKVVDTDLINGIVQKYYLPTALAFIPDPNMFNNLLNEESELFFIEKNDEEKFIKDFKNFIKKYKTEKANENSIIFNLSKIG